MKLIIHNNNSYSGTISILGAKNSAVAIIPASIILDGKTTLYNVPDIKDTRILLSVLSELGLTTTFNNNIVTIEGKPNNFIITNKEVSSLRASYYFYSSLLSLFNHVCSYLPGGCNLGLRPINYHLDGFKALGCQYITFDNYIEIISDNLKPNVINLDFPSVGATINLIILSVKIKGVTTLINPSFEPEVLDLINFLVCAGANITISSDRIIIVGKERLHSIKYKIIPDRIEAGSYMLLGLLKPFNGLRINNIKIDHLTEVINVIKKIGGKLVIKKNSITVFPPDEIKPTSITSKVYPGFPTDLIQIISVVLASSNKPSQITDTIFSNRYNYLEELRKLNVKIIFKDDSYFVSSCDLNNNASLVCEDLRGAFALFASSFLSFGDYTLENIEYIFRGYNDFLSVLEILKIDYEFN